MCLTDEKKRWWFSKTEPKLDFLIIVLTTFSVANVVLQEQCDNAFSVQASPCVLALHLSNGNTALSGIKLAWLYFLQTRQQDEKWSWISGKRAAVQTSGYTSQSDQTWRNRQHEIPLRNAESTQRSRDTFHSLTYPRKTLSAYGCLESVLRTLQSFSFVEKANLWNFYVGQHLALMV